MPPSGLRQVWFLRRSRTPRISSSAAHAPVISEESSLAAFPRVKFPSGDTRWHDGQPMNINRLGMCGIEDIPHFLSFRSRPM